MINHSLAVSLLSAIVASVLNYFENVVSQKKPLNYVAEEGAKSLVKTFVATACSVFAAMYAIDNVIIPHPSMKSFFATKKHSQTVFTGEMPSQPMSSSEV